MTSITCPNCKGSPSDKLKEPLRGEILGKMEVYVCGNCGLLFVEKLPPFVGGLPKSDRE